MKHGLHIPNESIAEYVQKILVIEDYKLTNPFVLPLYANGFPTLLFQTCKGKIGNTATSSLTLFGQTVLPETLVIDESFTLIAYFFKPYAIVSLFGFSAQELTDKPIDLNLLKEAKVSLLQEQLLNAGSVEKMIQVLDGFIVKLIETSKTNTVIQYAANHILNNSAGISLVSLQKDMNMTERTFQRLFDKNIGVSPNLYRRIAQFNTAFDELNARKFSTLTDLAYKNGYADQSHYIRTFREFTGITPSDYLKFGSSE